MPTSPELEITKEIEVLRQQHQKEMDLLRQAHSLELTEAQKLSQLETLKFSLDKQAEMQNKQNRLETLRLAKETLIENAKVKPVDSREVTTEDIENFAKSLESHINK